MKRLMLKEEVFKGSSIDLSQIYPLFKDSYEKATGKAWSYEKFISRARHWLFFGDMTGGICVRVQRSGLYKLTASYGNIRSIIKGFNELEALNKPVWGFVSLEIQKALHKKGYITPPVFILKMLVPLIASKVLGNDNVKINNDGSIMVDYSDVGVVRKYFVANKEYYKWLLTNEQVPLPGLIKNFIKGFFK